MHHTLVTIWKVQTTTVSLTHSPVDGSEELHAALVGDHLDGPRDGVLPVVLEPDPDPEAADLRVLDAAQLVQLLHLLNLLHTEKYVFS